MRFFEFAAPNQDQNTVSQLVDIVKNPNTDPKLKNEILAILKQLEVKGTKQDKQLNAIPPSEEITKEAVGDDTLSTIESDEDYYQRILNSDPRLKAIAEKKLKDAESAGFNVGSSLSAGDAFKRFNDQVLSLVQHLKQLPPDFSKEVTKTFSHLATQGIDQQDLISFLQDCAKPERLIDLPELIANSGTGIKLNIPTKYQEIVKHLVAVTPGSKNAAAGKGELMLAVIGKDTVKPAVGDIIVGNKRVEVKASDATGKSLSDFALGKQPVEKARTIMVNTINSKLGREVFLDATADTSNDQGVTGISSISTRNIAQLNKIFSEMGAKTTQKMFREMFTAVVGSKFSEDIDKIVAAIDNNGIQIEPMRKAIVGLLFDYYKSVNQHTGLLTINVPTLTINYVEDAEAFSSIPNLTIGTLFDFRSNPGSITSFKQK
jgi:hypothetical protein